MPPIPRPGGGASKLQLPSKWEGGTGSGPSWGWDVVAEHPCPGRVRPGANRGLRLPPFRASQKVLHRFTCPLKEPLFDHLEFRGELFQARRVLPAPFEKSFLLLKKLLSGITRFYYPQKYSTFFDGPTKTLLKFPTIILRETREFGELFVPFYDAFGCLTPERPRRVYRKNGSLDF